MLTGSIYTFDDCFITDFYVTFIIQNEYFITIFARAYIN